MGRPWRGKQSGGTLLEGALGLKVPEGWGLGGFGEISWAWRVCQVPKYPQCARPAIIFESEIQAAGKMPRTDEIQLRMREKESGRRGPRVTLSSNFLVWATSK